jgi:hypothetical protein
MITRRCALQLGAVGLAGGLAPVGGWARDVSEIGGDERLARAVFDGRFAESVTFARELQGRGVATSAISDLAALWYQDLRSHLRSTSLPLAGLTDRAALFCLEELARDLHMKVVYRVDRTVLPEGRTSYDATGPAAAIEATRGLGRHETFGQAMAELATRTDARKRGGVAAQKRTGPSSARSGTALVAWLIA